jgi:hypothetical protein
MSISIQTLNDALIAIAVTVGIAVALSIAYFVAGVFHERGQARAHAAVRPAPTPVHPDDTRELVSH